MKRDLLLALGLGALGLLPAAVGAAFPSSVALTALAWTALGIVWIILALPRAERIFWTLLGAGLVAGIGAALLQSPLAPAEQRAPVAMFGLVAGIVWGALAGGIALGIQRRRERNRA